MRNKRRVLSYLLVFAMLFCISPIQAIADTNVNSGISNPTYGQGAGAWRMPKDSNLGLRVSLYWAPSAESFINGEAQQVGQIIDIFPDNPRYIVEEYTGASVYDYMNKKSTISKYRYNTTGYSYYNKTNVSGTDVVTTLPNIINTPQTVWHEWLESPENNTPTYKRIGELANLMGAPVTATDFTTGTKTETDGSSTQGLYKLYLEPMVSMVVNGNL